MMCGLKINRAVVITAISICCIAFLQKEIFAQEDNFIRPGIGVGKFKLGVSNEVINEIIKRKFDDIQKVSSEEDFEMWLSYKKMGLTLIYSKDKKLKRIRVINKALLVENTRISVGSYVTDLRRYKKIFKDIDTKIKNTVRKKNTNPLDFEKLGIKFWISWNDQKIFAIEVKEKKLD